MAMMGSSAIANAQVLPIIGKRLHRATLDVELRLQRQHVFERGTAMFADIAEGEIAAIHPQHDERPRDAENGRSLGGADFLLLRNYRHALATEQAGLPPSARQFGSPRGKNYRPSKLSLVRTLHIGHDMRAPSRNPIRYFS